MYVETNKVSPTQSGQELWAGPSHKIQGVKTNQDLTWWWVKPIWPYRYFDSEGTGKGCCPELDVVISEKSDTESDTPLRVWVSRDLPLLTGLNTYHKPSVQRGQWVPSGACVCLSVCVLSTASVANQLWVHPRRFANLTLVCLPPQIPAQQYSHYAFGGVR